MDNNSNGVARTAAKVGTALVVGAVTFLTMGVAAFAAPPDPGGTGAAMGDVETGITSWVTTYGIPSIVAILLVGLGLALLMKFARKARGAI